MNESKDTKIPEIVPLRLDTKQPLSEKRLKALERARASKKIKAAQRKQESLEKEKKIKLLKKKLKKVRKRLDKPVTRNLKPAETSMTIAPPTPIASQQQQPMAPTQGALLSRRPKFFNSSIQF